MLHMYNFVWSIRVVAKKIVCRLVFHLSRLKEGAKRVVGSAEPTWGRVWVGVAPSYRGGPGGLPWGILKILMKIDALWCNLEPLLYKMKPI